MSLAKWSSFKWPEWVPSEVRKEIKAFWSNSQGRDYREWQRSCSAPYNYQPKLGDIVRVKRNWGKRVRKGRWIPCWNNIARIVLSDGSWHVVSTCDIVKIAAGEDKKNNSTVAKQPSPKLTSHSTLTSGRFTLPCSYKGYKFKILCTIYKGKVSTVSLAS
jgi:hypothetical protein